LMLTEGAPGFAELEGGELVWDNPHAYVQLSVVFRINKVTMPMLFAVSDKDGDLLLNQIAMYNDLRQFGQVEATDAKIRRSLSA
jgi:hypothetical protein